MDYSLPDSTVFVTLQAMKSTDIFFDVFSHMSEINQVHYWGNAFMLQLMHELEVKDV